MDQRKDTEIDRELDGFFKAARSEKAVPSEALMAAILRDAQAEMPRSALVSGQTKLEPVPSGGFLQNLFSGIGGWQVTTVLAASACFGLWIGYAMPEKAALVGMDYVATDELTEDDYAFYSDIDDLLAEG